MFNRRTWVVSSYLVPVATSSAGVAEVVNPQLETEVPGFDHVSSVAASFAAADVLVLGMHYAADRYELRGDYQRANWLRSKDRAAAWIGSIATQFLCESNVLPFLGTADYRDALFGMAATVPGIVAGQSQARGARGEEPL